MSVFGGIFARSANPENKKAAEKTIDQLTLEWIERQESSGSIVVTPETAQRAPTVAAIVRAFCLSMSMLPFAMYRRESAGRYIQRDHPLTWLLGFKPNKTHTPQEFWKLVAKTVTLHGFFLAIKLRSGTRITELVPVPARSVTFDVDGLGRRIFRVAYKSEVRTISQGEAFFVSDLLAEDGITPMSPVHQCGEAIGLEIAAQRFGTQFFDGSAIPNVIIERPGRFRTEEEQSAFARQWNSLFKKRRGTAVLESGWTVKQVQLSNEESQFLDTRKLQRSVIAGMWGIPPHKVGDMEKATFRNVEEQSISWVRDALTPLLVSVEGAIMRDLMTESDVRLGFYPRFNVEGLKRGDEKSRSESLWQQFQAGVISSNEWRALEERNPRADEDGDAYMTPVNLRMSTDEDETEPVTE